MDANDGGESVAYHRATVLERGDDHPGLALAYYASRGEMPMVWAGSGASSLGLSGAVSPAAYEVVFGPGGATDPASGDRLVATRRPGMELVISAHKSVAELGVIGRAGDMHAILDAERDATLAYLDGVTRQMGGRRSGAATVTATGGLIYSHTRHATSRAWDPCPHDHVLLANVVEMLDEAGGWKAADTTLWREHLHAATMVGRLAAARAAVELGYGIEADPGPSGRLGQWRIGGIPDEVLAVHSKRAVEITAECGRRGESSYRARSVAARTTRSAKEHDSEAELVGRWRAELAGAGWPVERIAASVAEAARARRPPERLTLKSVRQMVADVLGDDGDLARRKVFSGRHVIVALAPRLFGQAPAVLDPLVARVLADPEAVPLVGVAGARERVYSLASVIPRETAIADSLGRQLARSDAPVVPVAAVETAVAVAEANLGASLSAEQRAAAVGICTSGRGAELVVGVAGAGKTTMLAAVAAAFEQAGHRVVGTATSGQAARTLGAEAGIEQSRTVASLVWRLDHHRLALDDRSVVILVTDSRISPGGHRPAACEAWSARLLPGRCGSGSYAGGHEYRRSLPEPRVDRR
ncbi:MAG: MobF family relaxase [Acidimicrobiales bacterium]